MAETALLCVEGLHKSFGHTPVLRGLDFNLGRGEALAIFGPNGVGKTTLLRMLGMLMRPSSGSLTLLGQDMLAAGPEVRAHVGLATHQTWLFQDLSAEENLGFYGQLYGLTAVSARVAEVLEQVELTWERHRAVRLLSHGMQRRLTIARAMLHQPDLLLLDEPYAGLDPQAVQLVDGIIQRWVAQERGVILTSHNLTQSLKQCTRWAVLARGHFVAQGARDAWLGQEQYARWVRGEPPC